MIGDGIRYSVLLAGSAALADSAALETSVTFASAATFSLAAIVGGGTLRLTGGSFRLGGGVFSASKVIFSACFTARPSGSSMIATGVPMLTQLNTSITSTERIRIQPKLALRPRKASCGVP